MSKQLTGALFVDIQGDNKNLKKSLNESKQSVAGFGAAVTQLVASNPALAAILGGVGGVAGLRAGFKSFAGFRKMKGRSESGIALSMMHRRSARDVYKGLRDFPHEYGAEMGSLAEFKEATVEARNRYHTARKRHAQAVLDSRHGRGMLGHKSNNMFKRLQGMGMGRDLAAFTLKTAGAFISSGAGLVAMAAAATAVVGILVGSAFKRGEEGRKFDVSSIREDALTKIARIKQNIQIGKQTMGQGFRGGAERFYDRQAAGIAPIAATVGNISSGSFWGFMGYLNWSIFRGGVAGGAYRWATGGDFF